MSVARPATEAGPTPSTTPQTAPLLEVEHLAVHFPVKKGLLVDRAVAHVRAVDDVSFTLREGETLGLVGESGCGKTTLARSLLRLLAQVGLNPEHINRFPHEFSGGQRQRVGVARALSVDPRLIALDEPVSALDVSIQAQVINLLDDLQDHLGLSYVFVAHDLSVVRHVSDRIAVMYLGKLVELSPAEELYSRPVHPYTAALLSAIPIPDPERTRSRHRLSVSGEPPNPLDPPPGCRFHTRCPRATEVCQNTEPPLTAYAGGHLAACHHPLDVTPVELAGATRSPLSSLTAGDPPPAPTPTLGG